VQQISAPGMEMHTGDFDGATLLLHLQTDCVPKEERNHLLHFDGRDDQGKWTLQQEMPIPDASGHVAIDGPLALLASEGAEVGYLLQREGTPDSWEFTARLVFTDPSKMFHRNRRVALDAGRAVIGVPYELDQKGLALTYEVAKQINAGHAGAWFDPATSGQGYFFDVHTSGEGNGYFFLSWFTYGDGTVSGQRWLTAQGNFDSPTAVLDVYETTGGSFNEPSSVDTVKAGTVSIDFTDCENAKLTYSLDANSPGGEVDLIRVVSDGEALCHELAAIQ